MKLGHLLWVILMFAIISCSEDSSEETNNQGNTNNVDQNLNIPDGGGLWRIEKDLIFDGGPGKDGIPALLEPEVIKANEASYLKDDDLVLGLKHRGKTIAFPHRILDWHEIINIEFEGLALAITYCPLTGSGYGWNRIIDDKLTSFGVSGLIYKNNLIPYDRETDSNWSQFKLECVNGELSGKIPELTFLPELKWSIWKKMYPETSVISSNTGYNRDYFEYPYGNYKTNNEYIIFPTNDPIHSIPAKERVYSIISRNIAKVYQFETFDQGKVIKDEIKGETHIVVGNSDFIVSFLLDDNTNNLEFVWTDMLSSAVILKDNEGNLWDIFGEAVEGPRKGQFLKQSATAWVSYYFAIECFYPDLVIYQ